MLKIRFAAPKDAEKLSQIYKPYVETTAVSFEFVPPTAEEFRKRIAKTLKRFPYLVCESDKIIVGYAYASPFHERAAYQWGCELSVYVDSKAQGKGVGSLLYEALFSILKEQGFSTAYACITCPNPKSVALHTKFGFQKAAFFHHAGYKKGKWHDVMWMEKELAPYGENPIPPVNITAFSEKTIKRLLLPFQK